MEMLEAACARRGRACDQVDKVLLQGITAERPLRSVDAFVEWAGQYQTLGITEIVLHWPVPDRSSPTTPMSSRRSSPRECHSSAPMT